MVLPTYALERGEAGDGPERCLCLTDENLQGSAMRCIYKVFLHGQAREDLDVGGTWFPRQPVSLASGEVGANWWPGLASGHVDALSNEATNDGRVGASVCV